MVPFKSLLLGLATAGLLSLSAAAHDQHAGPIVVENAWTRATPPGAAVAGGYLTIVNNGTDDDALVAVRSDAAEIVELHEMRMDGDVMKMRPVETIPVPAGETVTLEPGGLHIMFIQLAKPLTEGEEIPGVLVFEKAGEIPVEFHVEAIGAEGPSHGHGE